MATITLKDLLEAGVHFGHYTNRWHPAMEKFIYTKRQNIHIIDLRLTIEQLKTVYEFLRQKSAEGGTFLFVGTKPQAKEIVREEAKRCGAFYVVTKWLGGTLTNFEVIKKTINKLQELNEMKERGIFNLLSRKEANKREKERVRLEYKLEGIKGMTELPSALIVIDPVVEEIAVKEAREKSIPIVAVCDTDANPEMIDYPVPGNDDAYRSIKLFVSIFADAIISGRAEKEKQEKLQEIKEAAQEIGVQREELEREIALGDEELEKKIALGDGE